MKHNACYNISRCLKPYAKEMPILGKSIETKQVNVGCQRRGKGRDGVPGNRYRVSFSDDEIILELTSGERWAIL